MLTRDQIDQLSPAERTALLRDLLQAVFGDASQPKICHALDITPVTLRRWLRQDAVPAWPLMLLDEWRQSHRTAEILDQLGELESQISALRAAASA